uniref:Uncharacterized protein n=1 Tax=Oryza brachyantha TaxID=4533 RepID=J3N7J7_ORYBR
MSEIIFRNDSTYLIDHVTFSDTCKIITSSLMMNLTVSVANKVGDLERWSQELDAHEHALQQASCSASRLFGSLSSSPTRVDLEATIETLQLKLKGGLPMVSALVECVVEAARVAGAKVLTQKVREGREFGWLSRRLDQLAVGLRAVSDDVNKMTQWSSIDLARKVAEGILMSFLARNSDLDPFFPLDNFPAGTDVKTVRSAIGNVACKIVVGFRGLAPKFSLAPPATKESGLECTSSGSDGDDPEYRQLDPNLNAPKA